MIAIMYVIVIPLFWRESYAPATVSKGGLGGHLFLNPLGATRAFGSARFNRQLDWQPLGIV